MYAVIRTGGKQYRVAPGDTVEVEKLEGGVGDSITIDDVLMVTNGEEVHIGQPGVDGASVIAKITGQYRGKKILSFRYRPKKRIRVRRGHRQYLTRLEIASITIGGETFAAPVEPEEPESAVEEPVAEEPTAEEASELDTATDDVAAEEVAVEEDAGGAEGVDAGDAVESDEASVDDSAEGEQDDSDQEDTEKD